MNYILIVDDHVDIRRLLRVTLGRQFDIIEAEDGVSALRAIRRYHPKIVLLDVMMPGEVDGLQLLDAVKSDPHISGTLVAILTARGQKTDSDEAIRRGADAYFIKPFSPLKLISWVREQLRAVPPVPE